MWIRFSLIALCCVLGMTMGEPSADDRAVTWSPAIQAMLDKMNAGKTTKPPAPDRPIIPLPTKPARKSVAPPPPPVYSKYIPDPSNNAYCKITTCGKRATNHTVCLNPNLAWGKNATNPNLGLSQISDADQANIVDYINGYRSNVALGQVSGQPAASNMKRVSWDPELAWIAQTWTQSGVLDHDSCRDTQRWISGQTIFNQTTSKLPTINWQNMVFTWYSQVSKVVAADVALLPADWKHFFEIGDYTQLVWADSNLVGCGISVYQLPGSISYTTVAACNWGPAGNWDGKGLYKQGKAGSACDPGYLVDASTGLCQ